MLWFMEGMCFLPTFLVIWSSSTFIVCYIIALFRHDVDIVLPYISDTGASPPESCVFSFMATITAFAAFATMVAEYKFVQRVHETTGSVSSALNKTSLGMGTASCVGMCFVATFQETTVTVVHDYGALLFFMCGVTYTVMQTVMSYRGLPYGVSRRTCHFRAFFTVIGVLAVIPSIFFHQEKYRITAIFCAVPVGTSKLHWNSDDKDYALHIASVVCEWITTFSFVFFFFTYIQQFQHFTLKTTVVLRDCS